MDTWADYSGLVLLPHNWTVLSFAPVLAPSLPTFLERVSQLPHVTVPVI